jgi:hypothetical protein
VFHIVDAKKMKFRTRKGKHRSVRYVTPKLWSILRTRKKQPKGIGGVAVGKRSVPKRIMKLPKSSILSFRNLSDDTNYRNSHNRPGIDLRNMDVLNHVVRNANVHAELARNIMVV